MRNLIFILFLAIVGFGIAGYCLDWYSIQNVPGSNGRHRLQIEFDTQKIREDTSKGVTKIQDAISKNTAPAASALPRDDKREEETKLVDKSRPWFDDWKPVRNPRP